MSTAERLTYLSELVTIMNTHWPANRTVNIACHGHSVPSGYFATPMVDTFNAYPHLLHRGLKRRFPFSVVNVIVTAIGGENSVAGSERYERDVLCHRPDVVTIDYGLNDRGVGLDKAKSCWRAMIEATLSRGARLILLTPTPDNTQHPDYGRQDKELLPQHADQIRSLASEYSTGLVDSYATFMEYQKTGDLSDLLSWGNHPNRSGHELVARELLRWFPFPLPNA